MRVAPNELSFSSARSWRDIYGPRKGVAPFMKSEFYDGGSFAAEAHSIVSVRDVGEHRGMTKYLANAFSDRSLRQQELLVAKGVDAFVRRVGEEGTAPGGIDLVMWFNLATFDIIGGLAFGQSFDGIANGTQHFWVSIVIKAMRMGALADCFKRFPSVGFVFQKLFRGRLAKMIEDTRRHEQYSMDLVRR